MKLSRLVIFGFVFLLLAMARPAMPQDDDRAEPVSVKIRYRHDRWIMAPPVLDGELPNSSDGTRSVFYRVVRAINPRTEQPYDLSEPTFDCDPEDLRHMFRLEKKEFILGEPILVEHRIELNGEGKFEWFTGGNYRARGRDDNYAFYLRRVDGGEVPDVYPAQGGLMFGGGLGGTREITKRTPHSAWLGLQRYLAIVKPGVYQP